MKKIISFLGLSLALVLALSVFTGCSKKSNADRTVIIYSNADDEAVVAVKKLLIQMDMQENIFSSLLVQAN